MKPAPRPPTSDRSASFAMLSLPSRSSAEESGHRGRYHRLVELSPDGILIHDGRRVEMVNAALMRLAGATHRDQIVGHSIDAFLAPPFLKGVEHRLVGQVDVEDAGIVRDTFRRLDGSVVQVEVTAIPFMDRGRMAAHLVIRDISERLAAEALASQQEARLHAAQRMEAIGTLAGGVAHEVNNMMVVVLGACDLLLQDTSTTAEGIRELRDIKRAADRAATVTRQLLSFSRRGAHAPRSIDLDAVVHGFESTLRRLLGDARELRLALTGPHIVRADPGQLEQAMVNLVLNARDALPGGGTVTISTRMEACGGGLTDHVGAPLPDQSYGVLEIADNGHGMSRDILTRAFEPFFTTKGVGNGAGLGLPAVCGIVDQNEGHLRVESAEGVGTTVRMYFPLTAAAVVASPPGPVVALEPGPGGASVLVIDDEPTVARVTARLLEMAGFRVRVAVGGADALALVATEGPPDVVLTDVMMPEVGGVEVARRLGAEWPDLPVLFMSGYSAEALGGDLGISFPRPVLEKPFTPPELVRRITEALEGARREATAEP